MQARVRDRRKEQWNDLADNASGATESVHQGERRVYDVQLQYKESNEVDDPLRDEESAAARLHVTHQEPQSGEHEERRQQLIVDRSPSEHEGDRVVDDPQDCSPESGGPRPG